MPLSISPSYNIVVKLENDLYRWYLYEGGVVLKKGNPYDTYNEALAKGAYWVNVEVGEGRL